MKVSARGRHNSPRPRGGEERARGDALAPRNRPGGRTPRGSGRSWLLLLNERPTSWWCVNDGVPACKSHWLSRRGGEEVDEQLVDTFSLVVMHPVRRVGQ